MGPKRKKSIDNKNNKSIDDDSKSEIGDQDSEMIEDDEELAMRLEAEDEYDNSIRRSKRIKTKVPPTYDGVFKVPSKPPVKHRPRNSTCGNQRSPLNKRRKKENKILDVNTFPGNCDLPALADSLSCNGMLFQIGDIVSVTDDDGNLYYAIIRGLLEDKFNEKSAVITWLLNTTDSPPPNQGFDPWTYIIGPSEELPRKLEYFEFVMHCPGDNYVLKNKMQPKINYDTQKEFISNYFKNIPYHRYLEMTC